MGRRVWSDPRIVALSQHFVAAADEVYRLQKNPDPECRFFRRAVRGSEAPSGGSMQGTYVFAPSGKLLARRNSGSPDAIVEILEKALATWQELPESERRLANRDLVAPGFRWEQSFPEDGLILRRTARDLPKDGDPSAQPGGRFNRDAVWFSSAEARSFLKDAPAVGQRHTLPESLTRRLSCLVFVDNVGGQTVPYHPTEDAGSKLWTEVTRVDGDQVTVTIGGHTAADSKGPWLFDEDNYWKPGAKQQWPHSIATTVLGSATFDTVCGRFIAFELLAMGVRRGHTVNQSRRADDVSGIGFVCELAPAGWRVAPTFINVYDVNWVARP